MHLRKRLICSYRAFRNRLAQQYKRQRASFVPGIRNPASDRRALLIYLVEPFSDQIVDVRHQNRSQALELAGILSARGFRVDVAALGSTMIPQEIPYDLVIDLHPGLTIYPYSPSTIRIAYITGSNPAFANGAEQQRLNALQNRRGIRLRARRQTPEFSFENLGRYSAMWFIGNEKNLSTYSNIPTPPVSFIRNFAFSAIPIADNCRDPCQFLFLASGGQVHKGLDLLLEIFVRRPEWTLHVCSNFHEEPDFCRAFRRALFCQPNILPHGFQRLDSPAFAAIAAASSFVVLPSCSEANAGSVLSGMAAGLVPIVSRECGFGDDEVTYLPDCSITSIDRTLAERSRHSHASLVDSANRARYIVEMRYSVKCYRESIESALAATLESCQR